MQRTESEQLQLIEASTLEKKTRNNAQDYMTPLVATDGESAGGQAQYIDGLT
ncbi:MAG: hypothetical protein AB4050_20035 [Synechococcus sp.]